MKTLLKPLALQEEVSKFDLLDLLRSSIKSATTQYAKFGGEGRVIYAKINDLTIRLSLSPRSDEELKVEWINKAKSRRAQRQFVPIKQVKAFIQEIFKREEAA